MGEASSATNTATAGWTAANARDKVARRTAAYRDEQMSAHPAASSGAMPAGNTSAARWTTAYDGDSAARKTFAYRDEQSAYHAGASGAVPAGNTSAARSTAAHAGCSSYAHNKVASPRRTMEYGNEQILRHAAASASVASLGAGQRGLDGNAKKRGNNCPVAEEGQGVKQSRSCASEAGRAEGSDKHDKKKRRLIDHYDMSAANKKVMAAVGGTMPAFVRLAAEKEAIMAAAPPMEAIARMMKRKMAGDAAPAPSRAPVQRRRQAQHPEPEKQPQPDPDEPQHERRQLLQPDQFCPRCHTSVGTVAPKHLCRCVGCSNSIEMCPFCFLARLPKIECAREMCPSCGRTAGKQALDHVCNCEACHDCPRCQLAKLPRPLPRRDGACPCCLENDGNASSHLCLCLKCKLLPDSACPFCTLAEDPSPINPFDVIRITAYSLM